MNLPSSLPQPGGLPGYYLVVTCPLCGASIRNRTGCRPTATEARTVADCPHCGAVVVISLHVAVVNAAQRPSEAKRRALARTRAARGYHTGVTEQR